MMLITLRFFYYPQALGHTLSWDCETFDVIITTDAAAAVASVQLIHLIIFYDRRTWHRGSTQGQTENGKEFLSYKIYFAYMSDNVNLIFSNDRRERNNGSNERLMPFATGTEY